MEGLIDAGDLRMASTFEPLGLEARLLPANRTLAENGLRPLTIVHVITRLLQGGAEENTVSTCLHQAACGHQVTLVHGPGANPARATPVGPHVRLMGLEALVHPISPLADFHAIRDLLRLYREIQPDIVHTHESKAGVV